MKRYLAMLLAWLIGMQLVPAKELTMDGVRDLAAMKEEIEWLDVVPYGGENVGSGLYVLSIPVAGEEYHLRAGGDSDDVWSLQLHSSQNNRSWADLWTEDLDAFLHHDHRIGRFRYDRFAQQNQPGNPGVNPHPFRNAEAQPVTGYESAVERAAAEATIDYDSTEVLYDPAQDVWSVTLYTSGAPDEMVLGGGQTVCFGSDGVTKLIVYGE